MSVCISCTKQSGGDSAARGARLNHEAEGLVVTVDHQTAKYISNEMLYLEVSTPGRHTGLKTMIEKQRALASSPA